MLNLCKIFNSELVEFIKLANIKYENKFYLSLSTQIRGVQFCCASPKEITVVISGLVVNLSIYQEISPTTPVCQ